jgi:hypothetical protein
MVSSIGVTPHFFVGHNRTASTSSISSNCNTSAALSTATSQIPKMDSINNYSFVMQKYMLLHEQHQELCTHLDQIRPQPNGTRSLHTTPSSSPTRSSSSSSASVPSSPKRHSRSSERRHRSHARCSGWDDAHRGNELTTILDEETLCEISAEEQRLSHVNESIKRALTELLNCSAVRSDNSLRMWVQTRLMETEKELRSGRRRRSSND